MGTLLRLLVLMALVSSLPAFGQGRGGGRGSTGVHGDESLLTFSDGTLTLGAKPTSGQALYYNGTLITGIGVGTANGLASLGSDGRVPNAQLPSSAYSLIGTWNANTDLTSPGGISLSGTTPAVGTAYAVTTSGSTTLGSISSWTAGDLAVYTAAGWAKIPAAGVTSFNSRFGAVVPVAGDYDGLALNLAAASSFRSPQGASCSQTAEGALCWDTDDFLTIGDGASRKTLLNADAAAAAYQPIDSDLTAIAALTTAAYGRGLLEYANEGAFQTGVGLAIGSDVQAYAEALDFVAGTTPGAVGLDLLTATTEAEGRDYIGARREWTIPTTATTTDTVACGEKQRYDGTGVGDWTFTLPLANTCTGGEICFKEIGGDGASSITVDGNGSETVDNAAGFTMTSAYQETCVWSDGTEWWRN